MNNSQQHLIGITPRLLTLPHSVGRDALGGRPPSFQIQLTISVAGSRDVVFQFSTTPSQTASDRSKASDAWSAPGHEEGFSKLDPEQPTLAHKILAINEQNTVASGGSALRCTLPLPAADSTTMPSVTVAALVAYISPVSGHTTMYEANPVAIDTEEVIHVEKVLGYRCRTRATASLDGAGNPIRMLIDEGQVVEGPSLSFDVAVLSDGAINRLEGFLEAFSPASVSHAEDILGRMPEAEVFSRLRSRYRLTSYSERCFSFIFWYRLREVMALNGPSSWIIQFLCSPPEVAADMSSTTSSGLNEAHAAQSIADIYNVCVMAGDRDGSTQEGYIPLAARVKRDSQLAQALLRVWTHQEATLLSRLALVFGPEPCLFGPKARLQQVLAAEIDALLATPDITEPVVEYSLQKMLQSPLALEAWEEATRLLPSRLGQSDPDGACAKVLERLGKGGDPLDALRALLPGSPSLAMVAMRPDRHAAFTRKQLRATLGPLEHSSKLRYKSLMCDAYAVCAPYLLQLELFLMALDQKKSLTHRSPTLWRRAVEMPDTEVELTINNKSDTTKDTLTTLLPPSISTNDFHPTVAGKPATGGRHQEVSEHEVEEQGENSAQQGLHSVTASVAAMRKEPAQLVRHQRTTYPPPTGFPSHEVSRPQVPSSSFQSVNKSSEAFKGWAGAVRSYSELYVVAASSPGSHVRSSAPVVLQPVEVALVRSPALETMFRSNLVTQMRYAKSSNTASVTVRRLLIPMLGCATMVDAASVIQANGPAALSFGGPGAGASRGTNRDEDQAVNDEGIGGGSGAHQWLVTFDDVRLGAQRLTANNSDSTSIVIDWSQVRGTEGEETGHPNSPLSALNPHDIASAFPSRDWFFSANRPTPFSALCDSLEKNNQQSGGELRMDLDRSGYAPVSSPDGEADDPLTIVFAVCDVIIPPQSEGPASPFTRLSILSDEMASLLEGAAASQASAFEDSLMLAGEVRWPSGVSAPLTSSNLGGAEGFTSRRDTSYQTATFLALHCDLLSSVIIKALVRCTPYRPSFNSIPKPNSSPPPSPGKSSLKRASAVGSDIATADAMSTYSDDNQSWPVHYAAGEEEEDTGERSRPIDESKLGKIATLFRSASGAAQYLDDGSSEIEEVPEREYPSRVRGSGGVAVTSSRPASPFGGHGHGGGARSTSNRSSVTATRKVSGLDRYRKDGYAGVVPRRIQSQPTSQPGSRTGTPHRPKSPPIVNYARGAHQSSDGNYFSNSVATATSRQYPSTHNRSSSKASSTRHLQAGDAAATISNIRVSAILGDTGNANQAAMPLTFQQERMLVRSAHMKKDVADRYRRDVEAVAATLRGDEGEPATFSELNGEGGVYEGEEQHISNHDGSEMPRRSPVPVHPSMPAEISRNWPADTSLRQQDSTRANFKLKMSYDATTQKPLGTRDFFSPKDSRSVRRQDIGQGGPLSTVASGLFASAMPKGASGPSKAAASRGEGGGVMRASIPSHRRPSPQEDREEHISYGDEPYRAAQPLHEDDGGDETAYRIVSRPWASGEQPPHSPLTSHYYSPSTGKGPDTFLERSMQNDFGAGREERPYREGSSQSRADYFSPDAAVTKGGGRGGALPQQAPPLSGQSTVAISRANRSLSRAGTEVDEHGVPYRLYDEISRSPSMVAAAGVRREESLRRAMNPFQSAAVGDSIGEQLETSRPTTAIDLLYAAGGTLEGSALRDIGQRSYSRSASQRPLVNPPRYQAATLRKDLPLPDNINLRPSTSDILASLDVAAARRGPSVTSVHTNPIPGNYIVNSSRRPHSSSTRAKAIAGSSQLGAVGGGIFAANNSAATDFAATGPRKSINEGWRAFKISHDSDGALALWTRVATSNQFTSEGSEAEGLIAEVFEADLSKAKKLYERAIRIDSSNGDALVRLGHILEVEEGDAEGALRVFDQGRALGNTTAGQRYQKLKAKIAS